MKSGFGTFDIDTPQDRQSSFESELVKTPDDLADNLSEKIIGLYGLGMSYWDISAHTREMYGTESPIRDWARLPIGSSRR
ncbi:transposase [Maribacter luteus]|uniref:transposase n=1 Tax=Maribacter luteus TaxID=2594478 RepID=UPI003CD0D468